MKMADVAGTSEGEDQTQGTDKKEKRNKIINDAVFGSIELLPICVKIIDTPEFQRLRSIHQLGLASYVYPTASNTRFMHSLGVYHVAKQWVEKLKKKTDIITNIDVKCVCVAALCFDLGHGPFSHTWDHFMKRATKKEWKSDSTSIKMFNRIWENLDDELTDEFGVDDVTFIRELMKGIEDPDAKPWKYKGRTQDKSFLYEIVINKRNGVDADKFAYVTRDSFFLGIKTAFDYGRLIEMSQVVPVNQKENKLCFKHSEELNVYYTFLSRWNLYRCAYRHRVVRLIEYMMVDALLLADEKLTIYGKQVTLSDITNTLDACADEDDNIDSYLDTYLCLVDISLFQRILELPDEAQVLVDRIRKRKLYTQLAKKLIPTKYKFTEDRETIIKEINTNIKEINMIIKEQDKDAVVASVHAEDFDVAVEKFNFGMAEKDPMELVNYYKFEKYSNKPTLVIRQPYVSNLLTKSFQEVLVLLIWKPSNPVNEKSVKVVKEAFEKWYNDWESRQNDQNVPNN